MRNLKYIFLALVLICGMVMPVVGERETFQDATFTFGTVTDTSGATTLLQPGTTGDNYISVSPYSGSYTYRIVGSAVAAPMTYSAADVDGYHAAGGSWSSNYIRIGLYDGGYGLLYTFTDPLDSAVTGRYEVKMVGGRAQIYRNGVYYTQSGVLSVNPSYIYYGEYSSGSIYHPYAYFDNMIWAETDHHVVGTIPPTWAIQRDLLNPSATGVYSYDSGTGLWTLQNSNYLYIDADKEFLNAEPLYIKNVNSGAIVNTTNPSGVHNSVAIKLTDFFSQSTIADGQYSVGFADSTVLDYFWVMSNGASLSFNKATYNIDETATITSTITPSYFTSGYTYKLNLVDIYGTVKYTTPITSASQTLTATFNDATYDEGVIYGEIIATKVSDGTTSIMAYSGITLVNYLVVSGYAFNAETGNQTAGFNISVKQGALTNTLVSGYDGNYTTVVGTQFLMGSAMMFNVSKPGFTNYNYSYVPITSKHTYINFSLLPNPPTYTGLAVGGIIRDSVYANPVRSMNVTLSNATYGESYTATSNAAGYYLLDNAHGASFTLNRLYSLLGTKQGYSNIVDSVIVTGV